MFQASQVGQG